MIGWVSGQNSMVRQIGNSIFERDIDPKSSWLSPNFQIENPPFDQVEIQLTSWCNRSCEFCPSGTFEVPKDFMNMETAKRIVDQLEPLDFSGIIGLHLICEPLLHIKFEEIVRQFRSRLPKAYIRIESNGDVLDKDFSKLIDYFDAGLNEILINSYDSRQQRNERNEKILSLHNSHRDIWYHNMWMSPPPGPREKWKYVLLRDFYEDNYSLRNWAGHVGMHRRDKIVFPLPMSCSRPFTRIHINYLGQVLLCNNDWKFEKIMGDVLTESLMDVWNSSEFLNTYRPRLLEKNRDMDLCRTCDAGVPWVKEPTFSNADSFTVFRSLIKGTSNFIVDLRSRYTWVLPTIKRKLSVNK